MFFCRIDDRFIHGQVGVSWAGHLQITDVLLANDDIVRDSLACTMQKLSVPNLHVVIRDVAEAAAILKSMTEHQLKKMLLIVNCPQDVSRIIDAGFFIDEVNIGHTKPSADKKEIVQYFNLGKADLTAFRELQGKGVKIYFQLIPSHKRVDLDFNTIQV